MGYAGAPWGCIVIRTLDARLIAAAQWVVDLTQRQPAWLARQCAILGALATLVRWAVFGTFAPWALALLMLSFLLMVAATYLPSWFHADSITNRPLRLTLALWLVIEASALLLVLCLSAPPDVAARLALSALSDLALVSFYCLAACHPPRPRAPRPRGRLAHGGAA